MNRFQKILKALVFLLPGTVVFCAGLLSLSLLHPIHLRIFLSALWLLAGYFFSHWSSRMLRDWLYRRRKRNYIAGTFQLFLEQVAYSYTGKDLIKHITAYLEQGLHFDVYWMERESGRSLFRTPGMAESIGSAAMVLESYKMDEGMLIVDRDGQAAGRRKFYFGVYIFNKTYSLYLESPFLFCFSNCVLEQACNAVLNYFKRYQTTGKIFSLVSLAKEWQQVATIQRGYLPEEIPDLPGVDLALYFNPLLQVSGDYYFFRQIGDGRSLILLGDVAGKGLSASLLMAVAINTINTIVDPLELGKPDKVIHKVDRAIKQMGLGGLFTALFVGVYDERQGVLRYINAGMPDGLLYSRGRIQRLKGSCPVLGVIELGKLETRSVLCYDRDLILLASDGITEVQDPGGDFFGDSPEFIGFLQRHRDDSPAVISELLINQAREFSEGQPQRDDQSFLVLRLGVR